MKNEFTKQRHLFAVVGVCVVLGLFVVWLTQFSSPIQAQSGTR
ncbi:MAG: hypothetical protein R2873_00370 [Caldilineaceae bacterium]